MNEKQDGPVKLPVPAVDDEVPETATGSHEKASLRTRFVDEFRKNCCPRETQPLILPSAPTDKEKYSFVDMKRPYLVNCVGFTFLGIGIGTFMFAKASPIFCWFVLYVLFTESYPFASLLMTVAGKQFDVSAHSKPVEEFPMNESTAPTVDIYLPICKEALEVMENTWKHIAALEYPASKLSVFVLDDGGEEAVRALAQRFKFKYICRPDRPELKKAGNMRYAFTQTSGQFFTVFDADFCPTS